MAFFPSDVCDPNWRLSRDGLIIAGFILSIVAIILLLILSVAYHLHKNKVRKYSLIRCHGCVGLWTFGFSQ